VASSGSRILFWKSTAVKIVIVVSGGVRLSEKSTKENRQKRKEQSRQANCAIRGFARLSSDIPKQNTFNRLSWAITILVAHYRDRGTVNTSASFVVLQFQSRMSTEFKSHERSFEKEFSSGSWPQIKKLLPSPPESHRYS
jgi:hypothetical protein